MIKTKIIETTEKYDSNDKLIEKITRDETTEDDEKGAPIFTGGATWWDKFPNILPLCCGRGESIKITY